MDDIIFRLKFSIRKRSERDTPVEVALGLMGGRWFKSGDRVITQMEEVAGVVLGLGNYGEESSLFNVEVLGYDDDILLMKEISEEFTKRYGRTVFDELSVHIVRLWKKLGRPAITYYIDEPVRGLRADNFMREKHMKMKPVLRAPDEFLDLKLPYSKPRILGRRIASAESTKKLEQFIRAERQHIRRGR